MIHIFGISGFLGSNLSNFLIKKKIKIKKYTSKTKIKNTHSTYDYKYLKTIEDNDLIIFFSGATSVTKIEKNNIKYLSFNRKIKKILNSINLNTSIIYISSDYVYSGKKNLYRDSSKSDPINFYGKLKEDIENHIKKRFKKFLILRSPKIFSKKLDKDSIYSENYKKLINKEIIYAYEDQKIQLLNLTDFQKIIFKIIKKNSIYGTYNLAGTLTSRYNFALSIAKRYRLNAALVFPTKLKKNNPFNLPYKLNLKTKLYKIVKFKLNYKI